MYIEEIYFSKVNTKYISSSAMKNQYFSRMRSPSEDVDIFTSRDEIYLVYYIFAKKAFFFFLFYIPKKFTKKKLNFFSGHFSPDLTFSVCLLGSTLGANKVRK